MVWVLIAGHKSPGKFSHLTVAAMTASRMAKVNPIFAAIRDAVITPASIIANPLVYALSEIAVARSVRCEDNSALVEKGAIHR